MSVEGFWRSAGREPDRIAVIEADGREIAAGELLASANRIVHGLRALGLAPGDTVAMALPNSSQVFELYLAAMQAGWYITPINPNLTDAEIAYVLVDAKAKVFFGHERHGEKCERAAAEVPANARFGIGDVPGFRPLAELKQGQSDALPDDRSAGQMLQYTSGTTGRPKGVRRPIFPMDPDTQIGLFADHLARFDIAPGGDAVHLCGSPMYHLAALAYSWFSLHYDHLVVLMDRWSPEEALRLIDRHRVTTTHMVPTQFHRLLQLPDEVKARYDVSSLRNVLHAAAPCPVDVKRRMLEWWGPVIYEYYGASEGGGTLVKPRDWLDHPGTVGRAWEGAEVRILDDSGRDRPVGETGTVYMKLLQDFEYAGDEEKTRAGRVEGFFTVGDVGYLDPDGYLYLCDRKIDMIISGGVNIYPAEVEAALFNHPKVGDAAVFGIPNEDWGEEVKAAIEPGAGIAPGPELADEILAWCREHLAGYKCPRSIDFHERLPRDPNGKLYKRRLRDPYWSDRSSSI